MQQACGWLEMRYMRRGSGATRRHARMRRRPLRGKMFGVRKGGDEMQLSSVTLTQDNMDRSQTITPHVNSQQDIKLKAEIRERTLGYMLAAFGFVAGLAWNDAIQAAIGYLYPLPENTLPAKFLYAVIISIVAVVISVSMSRLFHRFNR